MTSARRALRSFLKKNQTSKAAFAARVGVSRPAISVLLSDEDREPSLSLALAIERETKGLVPARAWAQQSHSRSA